MSHYAQKLMRAEAYQDPMDFYVGLGVFHLMLPFSWKVPTFPSTDLEMCQKRRTPPQILSTFFPSPSCWSSLLITPESNVNGGRARNWYLESKRQPKWEQMGTRMNKLGEQAMGDSYGFLLFFETVALFLIQL